MKVKVKIDETEYPYDAVWMGSALHCFTNVSKCLSFSIHFEEKPQRRGDELLEAFKKGEESVKPKPRKRGYEFL